jgi:HK97 family phage major capsid protein
MKSTEQLLNGQASAQELREGRAWIKEQMRDIVNSAEKQSRDLNKEEDERFMKFDEDYQALTRKLERQQRVEELQKEQIEQRAQRGEAEQATKQLSPEDKDKQYRSIFSKYLRWGATSLNASEQQILMEKRGTDPQTTADAQGGYTIPQGFSDELEIRMKYFGEMLNVARLFNTATGNQVDWPTVDDTSAIGSILTETAGAATVQDMTFANKVLDAYTYTSGIVKVSVQLAQDSAFDLENFIIDSFAERLGRIINQHATTGTGTAQPNGFVTAATVGKTATAVDAITRAELVDLLHSVDRAYRPNGIWMFNDTTLAAIKKLSFGSADDRPLWVPSMRDGEPDTLEGYAYSVNNDMADLGASNKPVAFGDFSKYVIRLAGDPVFVRMQERYMDELKVGFISYRRMDGELIQANAIKVLQNAAT